MRVQLNNLLASSEERELQHQLLEIARSGSMQESIIYFVEFAYNGASSKIHTLHRIRCLLLVVQLASPEEIERYGKSYDEIRGYLQMLLYLLDFEELRIVQSIKEFDECDKEALARSLWLNHGGEAKVVQLICNLCLDYGIHDLSLWENALARLVQLGAIRYLAGIIDIVTTTPELSKMKNLPAVWNRVLIMCLEEVAARQDIYLFDRVLSLIQKCPYLYDLDLDTIVESVLSLDLLIEDAKDGPTSRAAQKKVLSVLSSIELADMARLFTAGKYPDSMELAMFHIYMIIDERRDYGVLETEPALAKALVAQLMLLGGTGPLLEEMRKKGKHAEADGIEAMLETETF
ncbi:Kinetochore-associated protein 1 [Chytriomyces hyalinus]|nr:Kinetochore-associated protein 1 [Chytriomyces hyalinus]